MCQINLVINFGAVKDPENLTKILTADLHVSPKNKFLTPFPRNPSPFPPKLEIAIPV